MHPRRPPDRRRAHASRPFRSREAPQNGALSSATSGALDARRRILVGFAGPRAHYEHDPSAAWTLLVADETGLPALLAILEHLPADHRALAVAEVADDAERQPLSCTADAELHWVTRDGRHPGTTTVLADAVRALDLPDGRGQAWGGGEALAMRDVRRHLTTHAPDCALRIRGYWKHRATPDDVE